MFDMTAFAPRDLHAFLARLGRTPWFSLIREPDGRIGIYLREEVLANLHPTASRRITNYVSDDGVVVPHRLGALIVRSLCFGDGPKCIRPTVDACRTFADMALRLPLADYTQPFRSIIVDFPPGWAGVAGAEARSVPVLVTHLPDPGVIYLHAALPGVGGPDRYRWAGTTLADPDVVIEDTLRTTGLSADGPLPSSTRFWRAALNIGCLATYCGTKSLGWIDPKAHLKHVKLARRDERGRNLLAGDVEEIGINIDYAQVVQKELSLRFEDRPEYRGGRHRSPHPHQRSGYWAIRWHGPGKTRRKLVRIPPTFVRLAAWKAAGKEPADLPVEYRLRNPGEPPAPPPPA